MATPRFFCPIALAQGLDIDLPPGAARHAQVLRLQPGNALILFNGQGGEFAATITRMGRSDVQVSVGAHHPIEREAPCAVHLWVGCMANERMDWLVEKATELGVASITPLSAERSVLKLKGERADKKREHWQAIAVAAAEQCGRNRVPTIHPVCSLAQALAPTAPARSQAATVTDADAHPAHTPAQRWVLSLAAGAQPLAGAWRTLPPSAQPPQSVCVLSGPEGGLSPAEEAQALAAGFAPRSLGPRVLRAETAPLSVLSALSLMADHTPDTLPA